jgi:tetratricopeptide (TPR) repeat protein
MPTVPAIKHGSDGDQATSLFKVARRLTRSYYRSGDTAILEEAITIAQRAVDLTPEGHPELPDRLECLAYRHFDRFNRFGRPKDLDTAIIDQKRAVELTPKDSLDLENRLRNVSDMLSARFTRFGKPGDFHEALLSAQGAVDLAIDNSRQPKGLGVLAHLLSQRFNRLGNIEDIDAAISNAQRHVDLSPQDHPKLHYRLSNLATYLWKRFNRLGSKEDLDKAIELGQKAVDMTAKDDPGLPGLSGTLADIYASRFDEKATVDDLNKSVQLARTALDLTPKDHASLAERLQCLAAHLLREYGRLGQLASLEEAIRSEQEAVNLTLKDDPALAGMLANLASMHSDRFLRVGKMQDLEDAISTAQSAVHLSPARHPALRGRLHNLSIDLGYRFTRTGKEEDLTEAIMNERRALELTPKGHPSLGRELRNLAALLSKRFKKSKRMGDLDEAIGNARRALEVTPEDYGRLPDMLISLAEHLNDRFKKTRRTEDLEEAIRTAQKAVDLVPKDYPLRASFLSSLAGMLVTSKKQSDQEMALTLSLEAFGCVNAYPLTRIKAARRAIQLLLRRDQPLQARELAIQAVHLLPMVCSRELSLEDQQYAVVQTARLAADACSLLLKPPADPSRALEYLEFGRGLIIGYLIDGHGDMSTLRVADPSRAMEFDRLRRTAFMPVDTEERPEIQFQLLRQRQEALGSLEHCQEDIRRNVPDHDRFLLPPSAEHLKTKAKDGPIIVVNVTKISSDAIIVREFEPLEHVPLPKLDISDTRMLHQFGLTRGATRAGHRPGKRLRNHKFLEFLSRLWSNCVRLVLEKLGMCACPTNSELPRVWWMGTGLASSLPFHAAGVHTVGSVDNTLSYVISSYTPTIKALHYARGSASTNIDAHSILLVSMPKTPGEIDLPGVKDEESRITTLVESLRGSHSVHSLRRPSAHTVLDMLKGNGPKHFSIAHFACHGMADLTNPSNSFLALRGDSDSVPDKLTVKMITEANLGQAWLAYLSACSTAEIKVTDLADEALHIASSFQVAGFGHVVAAMWPSKDAICAQMASVFYQRLLTNREIKKRDMSVASALHAAVTEVRAQYLTSPHLWAQYIHSGA